MVTAITENNVFQLVGLSSDVKPVKDIIQNGSLFFEMDTAKLFIYNAESKEWIDIENVTANSTSAETLEKNFKGQLKTLKAKLSYNGDVKIVTLIFDLINYNEEKLGELKNIIPLTDVKDYINKIIYVEGSDIGSMKLTYSADAVQLIDANDTRFTLDGLYDLDEEIGE